MVKYWPSFGLLGTSQARSPTVQTRASILPYKVGHSELAVAHKYIVLRLLLAILIASRIRRWLFYLESVKTNNRYSKNMHHMFDTNVSCFCRPVSSDSVIGKYGCDIGRPVDIKQVSTRVYMCVAGGEGTSGCLMDVVV
jgi:hypothetical protein